MPVQFDGVTREPRPAGALLLSVNGQRAGLVTRENLAFDELRRTWMAKLGDSCLFISAKERENIDEMRDVLYKRVRELHVQKYPYNDFLYPTED